MDDTNRGARDLTAPAQAPWHSKFELDPSVPHAARVYNYFLGRSDWFPADRIFAEKVLAVAPYIVPCARANKRFLSRVIRFLSEKGVHQFIDIGCGLPNNDLVHDIAWRANPRAKTLYVDYDTLVVTRMNDLVDVVDPARKLLSVMQADIREIDVILNSGETRRLIDFTQPVGLLMVAVLQFLGPADDAAGLMAHYRHAMPAGSYFAASLGTLEGVPTNVLEQSRKAGRLYAPSRNPGYFRTRSEFQEFFEGWDLVDPGIVWLPEWHAEDGPAVDGPETAWLAGVGKK